MTRKRNLILASVCLVVATGATDAIDIDFGRQLFVDDFLIERTDGVATLRRDGFAGMVADGKGELLTKPVRFSSQRLFVNAECRFGSLAAEVLDADGKPLEGFTRKDCKALQMTDATKAELVFAGGDLSALAGRDVRFRFLLHCGTLYSFWVSPSAKGESRGYVAAGGPAYSGLRDL